MKKSLLIGCGRDRRKQVALRSRPDWLGTLVTLDMSPDVGADIVWDMEKRPLPFMSGEFCEIGAFNCLEHWGRQGDWRGWFAEMAEYHRILEPGGHFFCMVPTGTDALADPGHTRFFHTNYFGFLSQKFYDKNEVKATCFTDYRWFWRLDFDVMDILTVEGHHLAVTLRKPGGEA